MDVASSSFPLPSSCLSSVLVGSPSSSFPPCPGFPSVHVGLDSLFFHSSSPFPIPIYPMGSTPFRPGRSSSVDGDDPMVSGDEGPRRAEARTTNAITWSRWDSKPRHLDVGKERTRNGRNQRTWREMKAVRTKNHRCAPSASERKEKQGSMPSTTKISAGSTIQTTRRRTSHAMTNACSTHPGSEETKET